MNKVFLLLGSNLSDPLKQLQIARNKIAEIADIELESSIYQTKAWGNTDQPDFLNQVIHVATLLSADDMLSEILLIEKRMGRVRAEKNAPRLIDIDILFFNTDVIRKKNLSIPHPHIEERRFVLIPLHEITEDFLHPVSGLSMSALLSRCKDPLQVKRY